MKTFEHSFTVRAPRQAVRQFHHDAGVLKRLTPPPLRVELQEVEPLEERSRATFTMWFGPIPVRWIAGHYYVDEAGFMDVQLRGPLDSWRHVHRFESLDGGRTRVIDRIRYRHRPGLPGLLTRLFFNRPGLTFLFTYRRLVTQMALEPGRRRRWESAFSLLLTALTAIASFWLFRRKKERDPLPHRSRLLTQS